MVTHKAIDIWPLCGRSHQRTITPLSQFSLQPGARGTPAALDRGSGDTHYLGRLGHSQTATEAQLDDLAAHWINFFQSMQRLVQRQQVVCRPAFVIGGGQRNLKLVASTLKSLPRPRMIDEYLPHQPGSNAKKMIPVLPGNRLVHQF